MSSEALSSGEEQLETTGLPTNRTPGGGVLWTLGSMKKTGVLICPLSGSRQSVMLCRFVFQHTSHMSDCVTCRLQCSQGYNLVLGTGHSYLLTVSFFKVVLLRYYCYTPTFIVGFEYYLSVFTQSFPCPFLIRVIVGFDFLGWDFGQFHFKIFEKNPPGRCTWWDLVAILMEV